ncbi:MAG: sugar transferase [Clostridia bacterium]|nr:sugar transferase [Clostridia bacterium]
MKNVMYKFVKRTIDILASIIGIILLLPITSIIWIANILVKDNGPIFFKQERIGKDGEFFKLYKYRSMVVDADDKLSKYLVENEEAREEYKKYKKLKNDPRITKVGKFIRNTSIDEFPQFINVLKGQMSLVGPRPYLPREITDMQESFNEIIKVKPGLTGLWQVNGRSETTFEDRLRIDKEYVEKRGLKLDTKIFIWTIGKVFIKEGAK